MTPDWAAVRLVVFDMDDTLYPEIEYARSGLRAVADQFTDQLNAPFDLTTRMLELFDTGDRTRIFNTILDQLGRPDDRDTLNAMIATYRNHKPAITLHPDATRTLNALTGRVHLALLSDGYLTAQQQKVDALKLAPHFGRIILTDSLGREFWKPSPRAFATLQESYKLNGPQCVYIGDNPTKDFVGPNQLGWLSVMIRRPEGVYLNHPFPVDGQPDLTIQSLDEIAGAIISPV